MTAKIIDGKALAASVREEVAAKVAKIKEEQGWTPGLAVVLVGEDPASKVYVRNKHRACEQVELYSDVHRLDKDTSHEDVLALIKKLNANPDIHGILVQLPVPDQVDVGEVLRTIDPAKDVDGFHPESMGDLLAGRSHMVPCTPLGVMRMLDEYKVDLKGKEAVVVGRSTIVGKPQFLLLLDRHATVAVCHSRTADLAEHCRRADVLVVAVGRPNMITGDMIKPGATVIDVGINRVDGKLVGDVEFDSAKEVAGYITPVPGGVGPMTIAMLLDNTVRAAEAIKKSQ